MKEENYKEVIADSKGWEWECPYCGFIHDEECIFDGTPYDCENCKKTVIVYV